MSKAMLIVTKYNINIEWENNLSNIPYGMKLNKTHLNAKAFGPRGEVPGSFNYFDQNKKKININDILTVGHHKISAVFFPINFLNYESTNIATRYFIVSPNRKTSKYVSIRNNNSNTNVININVSTNY